MRTEETRDETSHAVRLSPAQRAAVIEEMNRILADPAFNGSKRCVILFKHLVTSALSGDQSECKERTLGIEVFGRDRSYDSQADPVVRMTANEIRKRLAQCYYEERDSHHGVKIRLIRGGYVPQFDFGLSDHSDSDVAAASEEPSGPFILPTAEIQQIGRLHTFARLVSQRKWLLWTGIAILTFAACISLYHYDPARSRQELFWEPLLHFDQPLMICLADDPSLVGASGEDRSQTIANVSSSRETPVIPKPPDSVPSTPFVDVNTANEITSWLVARGRKVILHRASRVTLRLFRQGPAVLIGGFDNPWSLILLSNLRYSIHVDPSTHDKWIEDAQNPSKREWKIKGGLHFDDSFVDYAVITRFWDSETGNWIIAISSLGPHGSRAASELITDDSYAKSLPLNIGSKANFQIILKTSVINGTSSPPNVLAVHAW